LRIPFNDKGNITGYHHPYFLNFGDGVINTVCALPRGTDVLFVVKQFLLVVHHPDSTNMATISTNLIATLQKIQHHDLQILKLSKSVSTTLAAEATRSSDVSDAFSNNTSTPAILQADLFHYKELFSKLRFSYLEQVTKEKFLRAITEDPPLFVEQEENDEVEKKLVEAKVVLREIKDDVARLLAQLEALSTKLIEGLLFYFALA
jgi:hypothetical protein